MLHIYSPAPSEIEEGVSVILSGLKISQQEKEFLEIKLPPKQSGLRKGLRPCGSKSK